MPKEILLLMMLRTKPMASLIDNEKIQILMIKD
jgi:hypothetical protein